jgi:hypothetical protein
MSWAKLFYNFCTGYLRTLSHFSATGIAFIAILVTDIAQMHLKGNIVLNQPPILIIAQA